jgi:hypothetical protein
MHVSNEELQNFTLDWCNTVVQDAIRKAQGMSHHRGMFEIPRVQRLRGGYPGDTSRCVIAVTLADALGSPVAVSDGTAVWMLGRDREPWHWSHPHYIDEFIQRFDGEGMPELDINSELHQRLEHERKRKEKVWRMPKTIYKGQPVINALCDIPTEPFVSIDWAKEIGLEGVAKAKAPETA